MKAYIDVVFHSERFGPWAYRVNVDGETPQEEIHALSDGLNKAVVRCLTELAQWLAFYNKPARDMEKTNK